jgi:hypothetical protein
MIALASLAAAALAAAPCGLPPLRDGPPPWRPGEELAWDVDVMGIVKAGTLSVSVEPPMFRGAVIPLRARLRNTSVFAKVRRVRAVAHAWVDARTLRPQRYRDDAEEDGVRRTTDVRLDAPGPKVVVTWTHGDERGAREFERKGEVLDLLSAVYYLRAAQLAPGAPICFDLVANRRYWRFEGTLAPGTERVETPAGTFEALRLDATLTRLPTAGDAQVRTRPLHLWFSDDARRLLVAGVSEVDLGPARALLARGAKPQERVER